MSQKLFALINVAVISMLLIILIQLISTLKSLGALVIFRFDLLCFSNLNSKEQ